MRRAALVAAGAAAAPATVDPLCVRLLPPREGKACGREAARARPARRGEARPGASTSATIAKGERTIVFLPSVARDTTAGELERLRGVAVKPRIVRGLGDGGIQAEGLVGFRTGTTIVSIGSFPDARTGKRRADGAKLLGVAKVVAGRLWAPRAASGGILENRLTAAAPERTNPPRFTPFQLTRGGAAR